MFPKMPGWYNTIHAFISIIDDFFLHPAFVADLLISLDDRYMYFSNWVQGDIRQYDITDRKHPKLVGQVSVASKYIMVM